MEKGSINVLLAEDDRNLGNILKNYLDAKGYNTTLCVNGQEAVDAFGKKEIDFVILDIMMPVKDGFAAAREIRSMNRKVPVLFKPFSMEELLMRMHAILRRTDESGKASGNENVFTIGKYHFDFNRQVLSVLDQEQKLTSKEAGLLRLLCINANEVLDRSTALTQIWNDDSYFNARSMDVYIVKLRKYLRDDPNVELINVHGVGFKLVMKS